MKECLRMCVTCHTRKEKSDLLRFVVTDGKITLDKSQKYNARGFYLCNNLSCIKKISKKQNFK